MTYDELYAQFFSTPGASWDDLFAALDAAGIPPAKTFPPLPTVAETLARVRAAQAQRVQQLELPLAA